METREFGRTGLRVSALGFGGGPVGGHYGAVDRAGAVAAVRHAIDRGITIVDTSPFYGNSEEVLGEALADGYRDRVVLCTKAGRNGAKSFDFSAAAMLRSLDASLSRLRTDHVDVWFAHDIEFASDFDRLFTETADAQRQARAAGKCRFIGMTGYPISLLAAAIERCDLDVVLSYCHHSLLNTRLSRDLIPVAAQTGTAVVNASALMMGLFSRQGPPRWHPAPDTLKAACRAAVDLCLSRGTDLEVLALQFVLQDQRIPCTLVGMGTVAEVETNLRSLDAAFDEELLRYVLTILEPYAGIEWPSGNWPMDTRPS